MNLSEKETREKIIDPRLKEDGSWREEYVRGELIHQTNQDSARIHKGLMGRR